METNLAQHAQKAENENELREIIGMTVAGTENWDSEFDSEDSDEAEIENALRVSKKNGRAMIRTSFQELLVPHLLAPSSSKLSPLTEASYDYSHATEAHSKPNQQEAMSNVQLPISSGIAHTLLHPHGHPHPHPHKAEIQVSPQVSVSLPAPSVPTGTATASSTAKPVTSSAKESETESESDGFDEESSDNTESSSESDDSSSSSSDDNTEDSQSSSWGPSIDDSDQGAMTYLSVLTKQDNANSGQFAFTPFDSVIDDATKSLKIKYDKITYPTGSKFFSEDLLQSEHYDRLQNVQLVKWIKSDNDYNEEEEKEKEKEKERVSDKPQSLHLSRLYACDDNDVSKWLKDAINLIYGFYRGKEEEMWWKGYQLIEECIFEPFQSYLRLTEEETKDYHLFKLFELLLHTFARLTSKLMMLPPQRQHYDSKSLMKRFSTRLDQISKLFADYASHVVLLQYTFLAHIDKKFAPQCIRMFVRLYYQNRRSSFSQQRASFELCVKALVSLDLYMENYSPLNHSILSDAAAYDIESEIFKWLDNTNLVTALSANYSSSTDDDDDDDSQEEQHMYTDIADAANVGIAERVEEEEEEDVDMQQQEEQEDDDDDYEEEEEEKEEKEDGNNYNYNEKNSTSKLKVELCSNPQSRINRLTSKYKQFTGFSFLRARVSWVIGHSKLYHERNFYDSEKYFFESLYCLKKLSKFEYFPLQSTMYTELASLVLIDYADVLLENKKYPYAIIALEKVMDCLQKRQKDERRFQIIRKLCITCTEKEDWNRAIKYHDETLKRLRDNYLNLNEFVYLSQQNSTIHLKLNNFHQSEKELQNGIQTIYENILSYNSKHAELHSRSRNLHNLNIEQIFEVCEGEERIAVGTLILVLSNLYISGGNYVDVAIHLLRYLRKHIFTNKAATRRIMILFQLARAYFKHGRYQIADNVVRKEILTKYSPKNNKLLSSLEFIQLRVLILIHCRQFDDALKLLDDTMSESIRKESFVKRAKIHYLRGCVLQSRCLHKLIENYQFEQARYKKAKRKSKAQPREEEKVEVKQEEEEEEEKKDEAKQEEEEKKEVDDEEIYGQASLVTASATIHHTAPLLAANHSKPGHHRQRGLRGAMSVNDMLSSSESEDINPLHAQSALLASYSDYRSIQDPIMQTKCCLELGKTYLEILMEYYALPRFVLHDDKCSKPILEWLGVKIFNDDRTPIEEVIAHCLDEINRPLESALKLSASQTKDVGLLIESYIALAEFEFLKEANPENQNSKNFWIQSKVTFFASYKDSDDWVFLRRIDRHSRLQLFNLFKRILRLLICYDNQFIADNVQVFVSYLTLETFMVAQQDINISHVDRSNRAQRDSLNQGKAEGAHLEHHNVNSTHSETKSKSKSKSKGKNKTKAKSKLKFMSKSKKEESAENTSSEFSRYSSAAIYRNNSIEEKEKGQNSDKHSNMKSGEREGDGEDKEKEKEKHRDNVLKNPTITFRIDEGERETLSDIQLAADTASTRPLYQRYRDFQPRPNNKHSDIGSEKELDELFRMHWKMRTESNMFSGGRMIEIDNDKSLVQITKCVSALNVSLDINCALNRKYRCWAVNETFIISLDSLVFIFHPHTLFKHAISKKRNETPKDHQLKAFAHILRDIAFHDNNFLSLDDNPWIINQAEPTSSSPLHTPLHIHANVNVNVNGDGNAAQPRKNVYIARSRKKKHTLSAEKLLLLQNELTLPFLKLECIKELLMCLDPQNILNVLGAIFSECQIILVSKERCRALAIIDALFVLMYPFSWQYPCIPWLSPYCFQLLNLPIPYIFGIANIAAFNDIIKHNKFKICDNAVIIDLDTNNLMKPPWRETERFHQLPLKIKSKLTRAIFRLMSGLLRNTFTSKTIAQQQKHWVFPPRRRDNISTNKSRYTILSTSSTTGSARRSEHKYNLLSSPYTAPISVCSERRSWYTVNANNRSTEEEAVDDNIRKMIIHFQKEFCTAWVEVLEQYRLFWVNINGAEHKDLRSKSISRIQQYAHPRYRKFLSEIQKTRMFSSFQCIRSLADIDSLATPMFDNLVMRSLKWRQSLYRDILAQHQQERSKMRVSVENSKKRHFIDHSCLVTFDPKDCTLHIEPERNFVTKQTDQSLLPFEVILRATDYELESDDVHKLHPYIDPKQVREYGERYQLRIKHQTDGTLTLNCKNYYELTRWIHMIRTHSMDTWSWFLTFGQ